MLLLNGRVSSLINPSTDPTPDHLTLIKVPVSDNYRKQLLEWLYSSKTQDAALLSSETREDLAKALTCDT